MSYYEVHGINVEALRQELRKRQFAGWFSSSVDWLQIGHCSKQRYRTVLTSSYTLPKWAESSASFARVSVRQRWYTYLARLKRHEDGHRDIAVRAARHIHRVINSLPKACACSTEKRCADRAGAVIRREYGLSHRGYDITTDHGRTQGARLF